MTRTKFLEWYENDQRFKSVIVPLFILLYIVIGIAWYYSAKEATAKVNVFNKAVVEKAEMLSVIDRYETEKALLGKSLAEAGKVEIASTDINNAQKDIIDISKLCNLKLETVNVTDNKDMVIEMVLQGRWIDSIKFLQQLERSRYFVRIDSTNFDVGQAYETKLTVKYKFYTTLQ